MLPFHWIYARNRNCYQTEKKTTKFWTKVWWKMKRCWISVRHFLRDFTTKFIERTTDIELHFQFFHTVSGCVFFCGSYCLHACCHVGLVQRTLCRWSVNHSSGLFSNFNAFMHFMHTKSLNFQFRRKTTGKKSNFYVGPFISASGRNLTYSVSATLVYCTTSSGYIHLNLWA